MNAEAKVAVRGHTMPMLPSTYVARLDGSGRPTEWWRAPSTEIAEAWADHLQWSESAGSFAVYEFRPNYLAWTIEELQGELAAVQAAQAWQKAAACHASKTGLLSQRSPSGHMSRIRSLQGQPNPGETSSKQ